MKILIDGQTLESPEINRGIGVYFKNVINNMVKQSFEHEWYITVSKESSLSVLDPWVASRLKPIVKDILKPSFDYEKNEEFTITLENIVEDNNIDIFWSPNPLMVNVLFPTRRISEKMFVTIYDVIPAIMPIKEWPKNIKNEYERRLGFFRTEKNIYALCISEATKNDFEKYVGKHIYSNVTFLAADSKFFYKKRTKTGINSEPYVLFTGGFDYRKNIDGAVKALSLVKQKYKNDINLQKLKMYIVCNVNQDEKAKFYQKLKNINLENLVELTGLISDDELSKLYANADLFFFPSLYEGFGLPILEAMLGGAFILSADNSSLPEVCGGKAILCKAEDIEDMAEKIKLSLDLAMKETLESKHLRQEYALSFSWEKTAAKTLETMIDAIEEPFAGKEKIAIVTPWPNQMTGIANYVYKLVPYLSEYFEVDIFVDNSQDKKMDFLDNEYGNLYMISELDEHKSEYKDIIYQIGNNSKYHKEIYIKLKKNNGIAEIHDFILSPFFYHSFFLDKKELQYREALLDGYGDEGVKHFDDIKNRVFSNEANYPMAESVVEISRKSIFHNHWSKEQIEENGGNISVISLAALNLSFANQSHYILDKTSDLKIELDDNVILIGCFGFLNKNKRPEIILESFEKILTRNKNVKLGFFGKPNDDNLNKLIKDKQLEDNVFITGYLDEIEYSKALNRTDIVINLRYPSMGESSATLLEAFKTGKPVIVSEINQYNEFPDEVCWKIKPDKYEVAVLIEMLNYLIENKDVRTVLGDNAKKYADKVLSPKKIAKQYYNMIKDL